MHSPELVDIGVRLLGAGIIVGLVVMAFETRLQIHFSRKRRRQLSLRSEVRSQRFLRDGMSNDRSAC